MGQDQSTDSHNVKASAQTSSAPAPGVHLVVPTVRRNDLTATSASGDKTEAQRILHKAQNLPLPSPLLPPSSSVDDSLKAALQGAQVMHDLRTFLDGLMGSVDQVSNSVTTSVAGASSSTPSTQSQTIDATGTSVETSKDSSHDSIRRTSAVSEAQNPIVGTNLGMDANTIDKLIAECCGGERMLNLVSTQTHLLSRMRKLAQLATQVEADVANHVEAAHKITRAIERLDRISLSISDVQDSLEQVAATSNILGAAHFADDDEMCSFKNYLQHHPPKC